MIMRRPGRVAKVGGFGMSYAPSKRDGSAYYRAPEVDYLGVIVSKSDVYSFGVILWEMCCGQTPYAAAPGGFTWQASYPVAGQPLSLPSSCPHEMRHLIAACIKLMPSQRPTWGQVLACLQTMHES